ncbi:MAG: methyltransferase domain-containing protein [Chloroflexi bacterium]|nr:methyltransferase domain-containing protein [Chloroflexota bacterium]
MTDRRCTLSELEHRRHIIAIMRGYRPAQVLIACTELGIFEMLGEQALSAADLARTLDADASALTRLMNAAVALGFLEKRDGLYANSAATLACLAREGPLFVGNLVKREGAFFRRWARLSEAVKTGRRPEENLRDEKQKTWVRGFEFALRDAARTMAPAIAETLEPLLPARSTAPARVIDVGGGHGMYSIALAQRCPNVQAVVFDLPPVIEVTREIIADSGVADRVHTHAGDFKIDGLGSDFDLALLFGVLVSETPENSLALLRKVYAALAPGGHIAIRGFYLTPDRTSPLEATLFDLHMLLSTEAGQSRTTDEVTTWLIESGFEPPKTIHLSAPEPAMLLVARKAN